MTPRAALVAACYLGAFVSVACGSNDVHSPAQGPPRAGSGGSNAGDAASGGRTTLAEGGTARPRDDAGRAPSDAAVTADGPDAANADVDATTDVDASLPVVCADDVTGVPNGVPCILHIDGRAVDGSGAPIASHTLVSACGPTQCSPGFTSSSGTFAIPVGVHLDPAVYSAELHVRPDKAGFYYALPRDAPGPVVDLGILRVLDMPAHGPVLDVNRMGAPAQSVTSGDVTLEVPDGVYVRLDVESNLAGDHGKEFRVLAIAGDFLRDFVDPSLGLKAVYALEPFESSFEYPGQKPTPTTVRLSFANGARFAAGAAIDVFALGTYVYPDWLTPATFEKVASAHVTADGSQVELDPGEGLSHLTWVALRPAS